MKKIFLTLSTLALLSSGKAWALSGGPFDNGDPGGLLLERGSFYQCQFSFKNGNGYGLFTPDAQIFGGLPGGTAGGGSGSAAGQTAFYSQGSFYTNNSFDVQRNANRSVFYYKGVTYVGGCFGMPDIEARTINGTCNATSDAAVSTTQSNASGNTASSVSVGSVIVQNNTGFTLNCGWEGKIYRTKPTLRFRGKGELSVLSPTGNASVTNLAFQSYQGLIGAIISSVSNSGGQTGFNPATYTAAQDAIADVLVSLRDQINTAGGTDATYGEADVTPVLVSGTRRYF